MKLLHSLKWKTASFSHVDTFICCILWYDIWTDDTFQVKESTNNSLLQRMVLAAHYVMFHCIIFRCSLCYCLVVRENCGYKNGTSHTQINWRRKSLGNWLLWCYLASLKCVVSWSGKIWKLCIKGIPFVSVKWKIKLNCTLSLIIFDNSTVDIMCLKPKYICHCVFTDMLVYIFAVQ